MLRTDSSVDERLGRIVVRMILVKLVIFFFQAEDGIRDLVRSRGLGDVYKRQARAVRPRSDYRGGAGRDFGRADGVSQGPADCRRLSLIHI